MATTTTPATASAEPAVAAADGGDGANGANRARLRLRDPDGVANRFVDGGWWPRTLDMSVELPRLLSEIDATSYPKVWAVNYNLASWDKPPHYIVIAGRRVRTGGFNRPKDRSLVSLSDSTGWKHLDLVMIAPDTDPDTAERALVLAGQDGDKHRADAIIALAAEGAASGNS